MRNSEQLTELDLGERVGKFIISEQGVWKLHRRDGEPGIVADSVDSGLSLGAG